MKKLKGSGIKILKVVHLLFAFMWIGGAMGMTFLLIKTSPQESHEMYMRSLVLKEIDDWLVIPGALGCFITGIVYGFWTNWGFFNYKWVTVKWIFTVAMILVGTFLMGPWVNENVYPVEEIARYSAGNKEFFYNVSQNTIWGSIQLAALLFVVVVSVFKPWKSKKK